ncbi:MAG: hypothetical protein WA421_17565 [Nitrososphaeraceae archaeon]
MLFIEDKASGSEAAVATTTFTTITADVPPDNTTINQKKNPIKLIKNL